MNERQPYGPLEKSRHAGDSEATLPAEERLLGDQYTLPVDRDIQERHRALRIKDFELVIESIATTNQPIPLITRDK